MEKNYVPPVDEKLFSEMKNAYVSEKENEFFERGRRAMVFFGSGRG